MEKTALITANGFASGPAQALEQYWSERVPSLVVISHPLNRDYKGTHRIRIYRSGLLSEQKEKWRPNRPPLTYLLDIFTPVVPPKSDVWVSFSPLTTLQALFWRRVGRCRVVVAWSVDYVDKRFGNRILNRLFHALDKTACTRSDLRVDLSRAALEARTTRHTKNDPNRKLAPGLVINMGFWEDTAEEKAAPVASDRLIFVGHLVERMGVLLLPDLIASLHESGNQVRLDVIGTGPLLNDLVTRVKELGVTDFVEFHGFVEDPRQMREIMLDGTLALAPYMKEPGSMSYYADPGKIKDYLGASLPIVMTAVPPIWRELDSHGACVLCEDNVASLRDAVRGVLLDTEKLERLRQGVLNLKNEYKWETQLVKLDQALSEI